MGNELTLFIGGYAEATQAGLHVYTFDPDAVALRPLKSISGIENPSYICINDESELLYAISELEEGEKGKVTTYSLQDISSPVFKSAQWYAGLGSCYISVDSQKKHAFIANYAAGSLTVLPLGGDGIPGAAVQTIEYSGHGPDNERQEQPHIHACVLSKDEKWLYCSDLGTDRVYVYMYRPTETVPLIAADPPFITLPPGSGPRHMACTANGRWMYLICEMSGELFLSGKTKTAMGGSSVLR